MTAASLMDTISLTVLVAKQLQVGQTSQPTVRGAQARVLIKINRAVRSAIPVLAAKI